MSKQFHLVQPSTDRASVGPCSTNWKLCVICQEDTAESLVCSANTKCSNIESGYKTLAVNLMQFGELGLLPVTLQLDRLDEGQGVEAALVSHKAVYHKRCMLRFSTMKSTEEVSRRQHIWWRQCHARQAHQVTQCRIKYIEWTIMLLLQTAWCGDLAWSHHLQAWSACATVCNTNRRPRTAGTSQCGWYAGSWCQISFQVLNISLQVLCQCWRQNWTWTYCIWNCPGRTCPLHWRYSHGRGHIFCI